MWRRADILVVALVVGLAANYVAAAEEPTTTFALERLREVAPQARLYESGSGVTRVCGQPLAFGMTPQDSAEQFKLAHAAVFGVEPADLVAMSLRGEGANTQPVMYERETGKYKFTLVTYRQHKNTIPVFRSDLRLLVRNEPGFPLVLAASSLRDLGGYVPRPAAVLFDPDEQAGTGLDSFTNPEPVIWAGVDDMVVEPVQAVTFIGEKGTPQAGNYERWLFVAEAFTGEILYKESRIILTDVTGNISGLATEIPKPDFCLPEVLTVMPWATAEILFGNTTYSDVDGNFTIPNEGTSDVTVRSPMNGHYFVVTDGSGPEELLSQTVTPPGPADFIHNADNTSEFVRAQVNGYVQANIVRDFALMYNPDYPVVSVQTQFPVNVNRTDMYCPGNAWYDDYSINFCAAGGGRPNTAFSQIIHHEYGHHLVQSAGSDQGQYGEGMSDSIGVLIADDPIQGYGWDGNCNQGTRTADNDYQYPCSGEIHDCGQLLSGCIWSTRNELAVTNPATFLDILSNLTVNSILLHTGTMITPQITIDFLTLDDDDGNIGNGTPHRSEICAGFNAHSMDCPPLDSRLSVTPTAGFDSAGPGGGPFTPDSMIYTVENRSDSSLDYQVTKTVAWLSITNASGTLGPFETSPVTVSINANAATLPSGRYTDVVDFVNTTDHVGDTTRDVVLLVGEPTVIYEWTLDTDPGWSTTFLWAWGQPTGGGGQYGGPDPTSGYTGSNVYGYNLDGDYESNILLPAWLTSTAIDCTNLWNVKLRFWRWLGVGHPTSDRASVEISYDGFTGIPVWQNYEEITDYAWVQQEIDLSALADNQPTVHLRWVMGPTDKSRNYCGWNIDDIQIIAVGGEPTCGDGIQNQGEDRIDCGGPCPPCECTDDPTCADPVFCNGAETCDAYGHCQPGGDPCPGQLCDEVNDICVDCFDSGDCDDDLFCNGAETCVAGACQAGSDPCPGQGCDEVNDVCIGCDNDGTCEPDEDCHNCPNDCFEGSGAVCGNDICETADGEDCVSCSDDCNGLLTGGPSGRYCCGDGTAPYGVTCADGRCTGDGNTCTADPADPSCCGDGECEGAEDVTNCAVDCGCTLPADCDDTNACTIDDCVEGVCQNTPVADETPCAGGVCCGGSCTALVCSVDADCDDSEACTTDTCLDPGTCSASCDHTWAACGLSDGCCGPACTPVDDPDCACLPKGASCTADGECCSNWCHRGTCK